MKRCVSRPLESFGLAKKVGKSLKNSLKDKAYTQTWILCNVNKDDPFNRRKQTMQYFLRLLSATWTLAFCSLLLLPGTTSATHIVGGEVTYTCLGQDGDSTTFEIQLTIFRDCFNGNPAAFFDQPASIGIFGDDNQLLTALGTNGQLLIPFDSLLNDTLNPVLANPCLEVPPNVCVHTTTYRANLTLPFRQGGYLLAYQRCCRNQTILNIVEPLASGATYSMFITEDALRECNSSAKFAEWPPLYICADEPIDFDQGAIDTDGDSIVYKLCTPLLGADQMDPRPQPPNNPPYDSVVWVDPPYSLSNMLNDNANTADPLQIDPRTGFLTGIPNTVGQFVVGICLEEYRNGRLISTTRRDFQYNVGICGETVSSFFAPLIQCDSLTVSFENLSEDATLFEWYFNDPNQPGLNSTSFAPTFTFSDTGRYTVMLIADPNSSCTDTSFREIYLQFPSLTADFNFEFVECSDSMIIEVTDLSSDTISEIVDWDWVLTSGSTVLGSSDEQNPTFSVQSSRPVILTLTTTAANGCVKTLEQAFDIELIEAELPNDSLLICFGEQTALNPSPDTSYNYSWTPAGSLDDPNSPNPVARPDTTTTYEVVITDGTGFCRIDRLVKVEVPPDVVLALPNDTVICAESISLLAQTEQDVSFQWSSASSFSDTIGQENVLTVSPIGFQTYYVLLTDAFGCTEMGNVSIQGNSVNVAPDSVPLICLGQQLSLQINNIDPQDTLTYNWSPDSLILSGGNTSNPTIEPDVPGTTLFVVETANQFGCMTMDTLAVNVLDTLPQESLVAQQQCGSFNVQFTHTGVNGPFYTWNFGDPNNPDARSRDLSPTYSYPDTGTYVVFLTADADCADTVFKEIRITQPQINLDFNWEYEECSDTVVVAFTDLSTNGQSNFVSWQWLFSNDSTSTAQNPELVVRESTDLMATLIVESDDGCIDTLTQIIPIQVIELNVADSLIICPGSSAFLNPGADTSLVYQWSPSDGLDDPNSPNPLASPEQSTVYTLQVTSFAIDTCRLTKEVFATVPPEIDVSIPDELFSCDDSIQVDATFSQPLQFIWSESALFDSIVAEGESVVLYPGRMTTYFLRATDENGCVEERSIVLRSESPRIQTIDLTVCQGDTIVLSAENAQLGDQLTYYWTGLGSVPVNVPTDPTPEVIIPRGASGRIDFAVEVRNQFGCTAQDTLSVNVLGNIPALFVSPITDTIIAGSGNPSVQLTSTQDPFYTYLWSPAESLSDATIYNPTASPTETTEYQLTVTDADGCRNQASLRIIVLDPSCEDPNLFVPNAFTPNQDGENDDFRVYGNFIEEMHLIVYNRWGQKVFETRSQDDGWDGTFKGRALTTESFGYYLEVRCIGGTEIVRKGNVTLLR
ncbi:MAG: gliding motility-associated C-terminal domain-containing protein [Bacteroidota bacterium]